MLFNLKTRTKQFFFLIILVNCIISNFFLSSAFSEQKPLVKCTLIYISTCGTCLQVYQSQVKPFYDSYRYNDSIDFTIIDLATDIELFYQEIRRLEIDIEEYGYFPWVIFEWGDNKKQVFDADNLDQVESTFLIILEDLDYTPQKPLPDNGSTEPLQILPSFNLALLFISGILTILGTIITLTGINYYNTKRQPEELFKRNSASRIKLIALLSMISFFFLTYQFFEFLQGNCGCLTTDQLKILLFQKYNHVDLFGFAIPIALLGIVFLGTILVQVFFLGTITIPTKIEIFSWGELSLNESRLRFFHYFLALQMVFACIAVLYLLQIEIFLINYICLLCTISQVIIVFNTMLIATWRPFSTK